MQAGAGSCRFDNGRSDRPDPPVPRRVPRGTTAALLDAYARTGDSRWRDQIFAHYEAFGQALAARFARSHHHAEDLTQVAHVALLDAIERFSREEHPSFRSFARSVISTALRRHLREQAWAVSVPPAQHRQLQITVRAIDDLTVQLGRTPRLREIAARAGLTHNEVHEAMALAACLQTTSLELAGRDIAGLRPDTLLEDPAFELRAVVGTLMARLPVREREILRMRFVDQLTDAAIAERVGLSPVSVSRLMHRALERLRRVSGDL